MSDETTESENTVAIAQPETLKEEGHFLGAESTPTLSVLSDAKSHRSGVYLMHYIPDEINCKIKCKKLTSPIESVFTQKEKQAIMKLHFNDTYPTSEITELSNYGITSSDPQSFFLQLRGKLTSLVFSPAPIRSRSSTNILVKDDAPYEKIELEQVFERVGKKIETQAMIVSTNPGATPDGLSKQYWFYVTPETGIEFNLVGVSYVKCSTDKKDPEGLVKIRGTVQMLENYSKTPELVPNRVYILADSVEPTQEAFLEYVPTKEDIESFKKYFGIIGLQDQPALIDGFLAPAEAVDRVHEKTLIWWTQVSPIYSPLTGKLFCLTTLLSGDSRESKSTIGQDLEYNLSPKGSIYLNSELSKRTGLVGSVVTDPITKAYMIRWGILVYADKASAFIDGISSIQPDELSQMREVISTRKASIRKVVSGERWMRARLILSGNTRSSVETYYSRLNAVRDTGHKDTVIFEEDPDWHRIHLPIPFDSAQADMAKRDDARSKYKQTARTIPADIIKKFLAHIWKKTLDDYNLDDNVIPYVKELRKEWYRNYGKINMDLFKSEGIDIILSLTYATAATHYQLDVDGKILVTVEHVEFVRQQLEWLFAGLGLNKLVQQNKETDDFARGITNREDPRWGSLGEKQAECREYWYTGIELVYKSEKKLTNEEIANRLNVGRTKWFQIRSMVKGIIENGFGYHVPDIFSSKNTGDKTSLSELGSQVARYLFRPETIGPPKTEIHGKFYYPSPSEDQDEQSEGEEEEEPEPLSTTTFHGLKIPKNYHSKDIEKDKKKIEESKTGGT